MKSKQKPPIAITLLLVWIGYMICRGILKILDIERIEENKQIFGNFALVDYWIDVVILIALIITLFLFIKRYINTWKYIIGTVIFLMIGVVVGQIYVFVLADKIISIAGQDIPRSVFLFSSIISSIFLLVFYSFVIFEAYKNRAYFPKSRGRK